MILYVDLQYISLHFLAHFVCLLHRRVIVYVTSIPCTIAPDDTSFYRAVKTAGKTMKSLEYSIGGLIVAA